MESQRCDAAYLGGTGIWPMTLGAAYWSLWRTMVSHYLAHGLGDGRAQAATVTEQSARLIEDFAAKAWQHMCGVMSENR